MLVDQYGESEFSLKEMVEKLMTNTIKDDESLLPGIYPPDREYPASSVFVDVDFPGVPDKFHLSTYLTLLLLFQS